jgi:dTDP-4-dehydrorhamnose reductase
MMHSNEKIEIWGGLECTINRVKESYFDQLEYAGHYTRENDIELISSLGVKMFRYPVLWERHQSSPDAVIDWSLTEKKLRQIKDKGMIPIAGLVHHGSGPKHVNFFDGSFENGLAGYAREVAQQFPWIEYYTPVNEPLTTARFCGLYGHWYPHLSDEGSFYEILISECKATVMAMQAIREINPDARLIQTDDLGKCYSTPLLKYQADYENERRWLSYELLCGTLGPGSVMWKRMVAAGVSEDKLRYFLSNHCKPHVAGFNYYITSERFLDENLSKYHYQYHGGNGVHAYADIEVVKVPLKQENGPGVLIREAWQRLHLPMAITECHLYSTREEQMRWFYQMWKTACKAKQEGVDIRAVTAWAVLGLHGWNRLVTEPWGDYEPGMFNLNGGTPRPTALASMITALANEVDFQHPVLEMDGWWQRESRLLDTCRHDLTAIEERTTTPDCQPLLIFGQSASLTDPLAEVCEMRNLRYFIYNDDTQDHQSIEEVILSLKPWAVIYADEQRRHGKVADHLLLSLADLCGRLQVKLLAFSSGWSDFPKEGGREMRPALIIRPGYVFGPHDTNNKIADIIIKIRNNMEVEVADDVFVSVSYVPDLLHESLNMLIDDDTGLYALSSSGRISLRDLVSLIAVSIGYEPEFVRVRPVSDPEINGCHHEEENKDEIKIKLPDLQATLLRYLEATDLVSQVENNAYN